MRRGKFLGIMSLVTLIFFGTVLGLGGCDKPQTQEPSKVRLIEVIHSMFYAPLYVALNKGFFTAEGLSIEFSTAWGGDKAATAVVSGNADIALIGPETTIYVYTQGAANKLVSFAQLTAMDGSFFVARKPNPDFKWIDVKGTTVIGGRKGGMPEMVLEYVMKQRGVNPFAEVNILQNVPYDATTGAFKAGTADFVQIYEPGASILEKEKVGCVVASLGKDGGTMPFTNFLATEKYIKEHPVIIQKFTNAIYRAQNWVYSHSAAEIAEAIAPSFPNIERDILLMAVSRYKEQDTWARSPVMTPESFDHLQDVIIAAGELSEKVPFTAVVNNTFAQRAVEQVK